MNNFWTRTLTAIAFVVTLLGCICFEWSFLAFFLLITLLAVNEFDKLADKKGGHTNKTGSLLLAAIMFVSLFFSAKTNYFPIFGITYGTAFVCAVVFELFRNKGNALLNWGNLLIGQIFIALPFSLINLLVFQESWESPCCVNTMFDPFWLFVLLFVIWINDTFAYLSGSLLGRHRFFERISPKKSWEGFVGGAVFAIGATCLFGWIESNFDKHLNVAQWAGFAVVAVVFGTFGDLIESLMKRSVGVKDSGRILPGHGGILDRFDSLMFAVPAVFFYLQIIRETL